MAKKKNIDPVSMSMPNPLMGDVQTKERPQVPEQENPEVTRALKRLEAMRTKKAPWLNMYQLISEYITLRDQSFTGDVSPGDFLTNRIFDTASGSKSAQTCASTILSMLWPNTPRRFRVNPPRKISKSRENKEFYEFVTSTILGTMDNPRSGLPMALVEYMFEQVCHGTAGVESVPDPKTKVRYTHWGVKSIFIDEGPDGYVDTIYIETRRTVDYLVRVYGMDQVSKLIREAYQSGKRDEEHTLVVAVEPRLNPDGTMGNRGMPYQSLHMEKATKTLLKESGFSEIPINVARFWKIDREIQGRSPAMNAMSSVLQSNVIWEATTVAIEKSMDPPLAVLNDGDLGTSEIDTSAGAINVFNIQGRAGERNPIVPLFTVGEFKQVVNLIETLTESIANHFYIDRLLDLNNEVKMTLGEANIRDRMRNFTLGSLFTRQIAEFFTPLVERTFNILLAGGHLGYTDKPLPHQIGLPRIPDEVQKLMTSGDNVYEIEYFTPALRIMQSEEAEGILRTWDFITTHSPSAPGMVDNVDEDESIRRFSYYSGAPSEIQRADGDVRLIRKQKAEMQAAMAQQEAVKSMTEGMRSVGQSGLVPTQKPSEPSEQPA